LVGLPSVFHHVGLCQHVIQRRQRHAATIRIVLTSPHLYDDQSDDQGEVETVLAEFETARIPIYAVSPPARIPRTKVQLFTDFRAAELKGALL
jgi:hypothetical protein